MNIYEIAKQAGVSPATVSRVINGNPRVGEENRKRVMAAIEASGFVPNFFARSLNRKKTRMVGILCPVISDINHARQVSLLEKRLRRDGFDILLCSLEQNYDDKRAYLELLLQKQVDAVFVIGLKQDESRQAGLFAEIASQVPVIIVNGRLDVPGVCCTAAGNFKWRRNWCAGCTGRAAGGSSICMTAKPTAAAGNGAATRRAWGHADWIQKGGFSRQTSMCAWKTRRRRPGRSAVFWKKRAGEKARCRTRC